MRDLRKLELLNNVIIDGVYYIKIFVANFFFVKLSEQHCNGFKEIRDQRCSKSMIKNHNLDFVKCYIHGRATQLNNI